LVSPQPKASIEFLRRWKPGGPWTLTSIDVNRRNTSTATFSDESEVSGWLTANAKRNIYFTVNSLLRPLNKKPERTDVASMDWLHVDVDPRPGEDLESEQQRALKMLREPPGGIPPPTVITFSGGGYQAFWRLKDPVRIDGEEASYEDAKRYNQQLEVVFGGDNCHNVDRVMRLPGTVNFPDEKKRKKGRKVSLAALIEWHDERIYEVRQFAQAPLVQGSTDGFAGGLVKVGGNVQRIASVDELPDAVSAKAKMVIVQGHDPDEPSKHSSRSEWLFFVCCEMVRGGCTDEQIYAVITDPDFEISRSVLDKGSRSEKYALRQIERAREEAIDPWLRKLNERHAVIRDVGGRCRIASEVQEEIPGSPLRTRITYQSFADFTNFYCNKRVTFPNAQGQQVSAPVGKWWINHPNRREYETIAFVPGVEVRNAYNLWKGFAYEAKPADCSLYLRHVEDVICSGNREIYEYLLGWMATCVQKPAQPGHTAIVLRGRQGTGKGVFANIFGALLGRHFLPVRDSKHLVGSFNAHLRDVVVLFADEAFYAGDKRHESMLKSLVTEQTITVEAKGVDAEAAPNYVHLIMASNEEWVVPVGFDERRFCVLDVSSTHMQDSTYFSAIEQQMKSGGYGGLLHMLLSMDLSGFNVRRMPKTSALQEQKVFSFTPEQEWWFGKLQMGQVFAGEPWPEHVLASRLAFDYTSYGRTWNTNHRGNATRLGRFLRSACPHGWKLRVQLTGKHSVVTEGGEIKTVERPHAYVLPDLATCRAHWDSAFGGPYSWEEPMEVEASETGEASEF
jgi:hypothetical protein